MVGRQGLRFEIRVWIGEVIFRWLVVICLFPFLDFCQQIRVDLVFKLPLDLFFLSLQFLNFFFVHDFDLLTVKDGCKKTAYIFGRRSA